MLREQLRHVCALFFALACALSIVGMPYEATQLSCDHAQYLSANSSSHNGVVNVLAASSAIACGPLSCVAAGIYALYAWWNRSDLSTDSYSPHKPILRSCYRTLIMVVACRLQNNKDNLSPTFFSI